MNIESVNWKRGVPHRGIDPQQAYEAVEEIRREIGSVTDDAVVDAARPPEHTLHGWFEWDDTAAAKEYRRRQARSLVASLEVVYKEAPEVKTRAYQVMRREAVTSQERTVYSTTEEVLRDSAARDRLIADAIRAAMDFRRRFKILHEMEQVIEAIDKAVEAVALAEAK